MGLNQEVACRSRIPSSTMFTGGGGDEIFRRESEAVVNGTVWYTADKAEQMNYEGKMIYSYVYNRCMVKGNRLYVLALSSDNPLNSDLIRQITPTLKSF